MSAVDIDLKVSGIDKLDQLGDAATQAGRKINTGLDATGTANASMAAIRRYQKHLEDQGMAAKGAAAKARELAQAEKDAIRAGNANAWQPGINAVKRHMDGLNAAAKAARDLKHAEDAAARSANTRKPATAARGSALGMAMNPLLQGGALLGVNAFTSALIANGQDAANKQAKLDAMLKARGESGGAGMLRQTNEIISSKTGADDDDLADAEAHLLSFGLKAQQIKEILPGAFGQAVTMGKDLNEVVDSIGRGFASLNVAGMRRSGIVIDQATIDRVKELKDAGDTLGAQAVIFDALKKSFSEYAVKLGEGMDSNSVKLGYFNKTFSDTQEIMGQGAASTRAAWQGALQPILKDLNENHQGVVKFGGAAVEVFTQMTNTGLPMLQVVWQYKNYKNLTAIATAASAFAHNAEAAAITTGGNAAAGAAVKFGTLARAKALAGSPLGKVGIAAAAVGATVYGGERLITGMSKSKMGGKQLEEEEGAWGKLWNRGGKALGEFWARPETYRGNQAEKQSAAIMAKYKQHPHGVPLNAAAAALSADAPLPDGTAAANALANMDADGDYSAEVNDIRAMKRQLRSLKGKEHAAERAALQARIQEASWALQNNKAGASAATTAANKALKARERIEKAQDKRSDVLENYAADVEQAAADEAAETQIAALEMQKGKGNATAIERAIAAIKAKQLQRHAELEAAAIQDDDPAKAKMLLSVAAIHAKGLLDRAALQKDDGGGLLDRLRGGGSLASALSTKGRDAIRAIQNGGGALNTGSMFAMASGNYGGDSGAFSRVIGSAGGMTGFNPINPINRGNGDLRAKVKSLSKDASGKIRVRFDELVIDRDGFDDMGMRL